MSEALYRLPDEPRVSGLSQYVVDPMWPLFAVMLAGNGFGLLWFLFNGLALGTPDRAREWSTIAAAFAGTLLLVIGLGQAASAGLIAGVEIQYAMLSLVALKLGCAYALYTWQSETFELWQHYGGQARNGIVVVILMSFFGRNLFEAAQLPFLLEAALR